MVKAAQTSLFDIYTDTVRRRSMASIICRNEERAWSNSQLSCTPEDVSLLAFQLERWLLIKSLFDPQGAYPIFANRESREALPRDFDVTLLNLWCQRALCWRSVSLTIPMSQFRAGFQMTRCCC